MVGQGRPVASRWRYVVLLRAFAWRTFVTLGVGLPLFAAEVRGQEPLTDFRLRIAWGGGAERVWKGTVSISSGTFAEWNALGIEADEPAAIYRSAPGQIVIAPASPRTYDGLDVSVQAPVDAVLTVDVVSTDGPNSRQPRKISLRSLIDAAVSEPLDDVGNRLYVRRSPGDSLRVKSDDDSFIFDTTRVPPIVIEPYFLGDAASGPLRFDLQLRNADGGDVVWSEVVERDQTSDSVAGPPITAQIPFALDEGVYDFIVSATPRGLRVRLRRQQPIAERHVQFVVLSPEPSAPAIDPNSWVVVSEIDPTAPRWWERIANLAPLPGLRKGSFGIGDSRPSRHALGDVVRLGGQRLPADIPWEAYPVPIQQVGRPHLLEIEYPSDVAQSLGMSIIEPNAAGAVVPIGLDVGVDVSPSIGRDAPEWRVQRVMFWPKTASPLVFVSSRDPQNAAVFRRIRVLANATSPPRLVAPAGGDAQRTIGPYFGRPMFAENFSAPEALDVWSGRTLDDWSTFYQGARRLVSYLDYAGYNGTMMTVAVDGSAIYPSQLLKPTPRYDTGTFFATAQDPQRKDVLELLLRIFDRNRLTLTPAIQFASPLPRLEERLRDPREDATGIRWVGADGRNWLDRNGAKQGAAAYYNLLDPRVQNAMRDVVRELAERYGRHPSLAGVAIALSPVGYAQLPGPEWGFDDTTVARFEEATGLDVPGEGADRFAKRAEYLLGEARGQWVEWRAAVVADFHRSLVDVLPPDRLLHVVPGEMFESPHLKQQLRPRLPTEFVLETLLYEAGINPENYADDPRIVVMRPGRYGERTSAGSRAIDAQVNQARTFERLLETTTHRGSLFYHEPQRLRVRSFDERSPFAETYTWLVPHVSPSGARNRQRFAHSLASLDSQWMFDGGWMALLGGEDETRSVARTFQQLPNVEFATVAFDVDPVTIRIANTGDATFVYLVNDSPWPAQTRLDLRSSVDGPATVLGGHPATPPEIRGGTGSWSHTLQPYDVLAFSVPSADLQIVDAAALIDQNVRRVLERRILDLDARLNSLAAPTNYDVLENPGFESAEANVGAVPGWQLRPPTSGTIDLVSADPHDGAQAVRLTSDGPATQLVSDQFDPPETGRLSVWVWLRRDADAPQPSVRLSVEGVLNGETYYRFAQVGQGREGLQVGTEWTPYQFLINDLPFAGLSQLRVRFDLMAQGSVYIDSVRLSHLAFSQTEIKELKKIISNANVKMVTDQFGQCAQVLDDYWPNYLAEHVTLSDPQMARDSIPTDSSDAAEPEEPRRTSTGFVDRLRRFLPQFR